MARTELFNNPLKVIVGTEGETRKALAHHGAKRLGFDEFQANTIQKMDANGDPKVDVNGDPVYFNTQALAKFALLEFSQKVLRPYQNHEKRKEREAALPDDPDIDIGVNDES